MRIDPPYRAQLHPRCRNQVMNDAQSKFAFDMHIARQQQIRVLCNRSRQRILDWNDGPSHASAFDSIEYLRRSGACHDLGFGSHAFRGFVTQRAQLSLNRDFHRIELTWQE